MNSSRAVRSGCLVFSGQEPYGFIGPMGLISPIRPMINPTKHTFLLKSLRILHKYCNFVPFFRDKLIFI